MNTVRFRVLVWAAFLAMSPMVMVAVGQQDPFNPQPDQPPGEQPAEQPGQFAPATPGPAVEADPTVRAIISSDPQTGLELLRATKMLLDVERPDVARGYVAQLNSMSLNDQQSLELYQQAGSSLIFRIARASGLAPEGGEFAGKLLTAAERFASDPERIKSLTERAVRTEDIYDRSRALSELRTLGDRGAVALLEKLLDPAWEEYWPRIREALETFGRSAEGPIMASLRSNSLKLRLEALYQLGNLSSETAYHALMRPIHDETVTPLQRKVATQSMQEITGGQIPEQPKCEILLYQAALDYLMDRQVIDRGDRDQVKWWQWNPDARSFEATFLTARTVKRFRCLDRANDLILLDPDSERYRQLYWLARLETAKLTVGLSRSLPDEVLEPIVQSLNANQARQLLRDALQKERLPAAIAVCQVLGRVADTVGGGHSNGTQTGPLIDALDYGSVRLTHAACNAIFEIDPQEPFPGVSQYLSSLIYLSRSTGSRHALIGHVNLEKAQTLAVTVRQSGFDARPAVSAGSLFEMAQSDPDLRLMVITDMMGEPGFAELVQALRKVPHTRRTPILLMVDEHNMDRAKRVARRTKNILVSPLVTDARVVARQIENLLNQLDYPSVAPNETADYAAAAVDQLAHFSTQPERYPYIDLLEYEAELVEMLHTPGLAEQASQILGRLGTPESQQALLALASNPQMPLPLREVAASSFSEAVERRGIMLTTDEIRAQYDRYNASRGESAASQAILGSLLDTLEKKN